MVKNRQIVDVSFAPPVGTPSGVEVLSLAGLRDRVTRRALRAPQRPGFHHLITLDRGVLSQTVDFTSHPLVPGRWLWVRPGQVQQWGDLDATEGTLVLFEAAFLDSATTATARLDDPHAPVVYEPGADDQAALSDAAAHLTRAFATSGHLPLDLRQTVLRHLLAVLVLRLAHLGPHSAARAPDAFLRFRDAVEQDFTRSRRLDDYAHRLGYSARTLSRATQAAAGVNAKDFIDRRVILEAKRLLAHGDEPAARIATRLGFTSATNFSKYFHQRAGLTPLAFRTRIRAGPRPARTTPRPPRNTRPAPRPPG
jgi:AraC-like DNA-binding protein